MSKRLYVVAVGAALTLTAACGSSGSGNSGSGNSASSTPPASPPASPAASVVVAVSSGALVAPDGRTLYEFSKDTATSTSCTGGCTAIWPPLDGSPQAASGVPADALGTLVRPDGTLQVTFAGHPLYEYSGDHAAGDRNGEGVSDNGGIWHVASSSGMQATSTPTTSTPSTTSASSSYGY